MCFLYIIIWYQNLLLDNKSNKVIEEEYIIKKINGKEKIRLFLESLGFMEGSIVKIISKTNGNLIVNIKNTRVAIGKNIAEKIIV